MADAMGNHVGYAKHCGRVQRFILSDKAEKKFCTEQVSRFSKLKMLPE